MSIFQYQNDGILSSGSDSSALDHEEAVFQEPGDVRPSFFSSYMRDMKQQGRCVAQPRMGFGDPFSMRNGLKAVKALPFPRAGTITVDSLTRTRRFAQAEEALRTGQPLNGYPIVAAGQERNQQLLEGLHDRQFPVQVRHGSSIPDQIFDAITEAGLDATEGGPISYCLPYGAVPLREAIQAWRRCCVKFAQSGGERGEASHLESFGGCMLGQLCPPSMLVAISILEGVFFSRCGLKSMSLSYAQGSNFSQDRGALAALRRLAAEWLPEADWHIVVYTHMGNFPSTPRGARKLIEESARLCAASGCERLIVKTASESRQIPSVEDNVEAMQWVANIFSQTSPEPLSAREGEHEEAIYACAKSVVERVLGLSENIDECLEIAFQRGFLDIPYCLHPDNANRARSKIDDEGNLYWTNSGNIPFPEHFKVVVPQDRRAISSLEFQRMLFFVRTKFDFSST